MSDRKASTPAFSAINISGVRARLTNAVIALETVVEALREANAALALFELDSWRAAKSGTR